MATTIDATAVAHLEGLTPTNRGTLALVGSGEYTVEMDDVDNFLLARLPSKPRVVCMPTAAGREGRQRIAYWTGLGTRHFSRLGAECEPVEVIDRATAMNESLTQRISRANFVYLSGGDPHYLYRTLEGTPTWTAIAGVLERGGVVAGCSAGAMIWGEQIAGLKPPPFRWGPGFSAIPGTAIIPHFDDPPGWLLTVFRAISFSRPTFVGIEGHTALVASDGKLQVVGRGGVTIWGRGFKHRYKNLPAES